MDKQSNDAVEWGLVDVIAPVAMALSILMVLSLRSVRWGCPQSARFLFGYCCPKVAVSKLAESLQCNYCLVWDQFNKLCTFLRGRMCALQFDDVVCRHRVLVCDEKMLTLPQV